MSSKVDDYLVHAFQKILRPLVKILIRSGVRYDEFCQLIKGVYIESGIRDGIGLPGDPSLSKVAIATGIGKRDVETYVSDSSRSIKPKRTIQAALSEVLHRWHTDPTYLGPYGVPLEIEFAAGKGRSFADLASSVDDSIEPGILLEELLKSGAVTNSGERHLKVLSRTFLVPEPMSPVMLEYFGNTITNLTTTLEFNMDPERSTKRLQRSVYADKGLTESQLAEFETYAKGKAQEFMVEVDNWLADTIPKDQKPGGPLFDVGISVFQYVRSDQPEPPLSEVVGSKT
jgi:Family of unknown function (DUF6502)